MIETKKDICHRTEMKTKKADRTNTNEAGRLEQIP